MSNVSTPTSAVPTRAQSERSADGFLPIADYGMLADCNSAALVGSDGLDRLALHAALRQPAVFARILDPDAGHWSIRPAAPFTSERRYLPGTLVLETTFTTDTGTVRADRRDGVRGGPARPRPRLDAPHEVLRLVEGVEGAVELELELAPRPEYGLVRPLFRQVEGGGRTFGGPNQIARHAPACRSSRRRDHARALHGRRRASRSASPCAGRRSRADAPEPTRPSAVAARIEDTAEAWRSWEAEHDIYEGPHRELVRLSSRVLKGLTYRPTGAIVAAPTTLAARDRRRRAQLGLPLRLDPRREPDARGALHRRVLGRGRGLRLVHDQLGRRAGGRGLAADHVRDRRRARPLRARAAAPARLARLGARCASATAPGTRPSSTSTASC